MKFLVFLKIPDDSAQRVYAAFSKPEKIDGAALLRLHGDQLRYEGRFLQVRLSPPSIHPGLTVWIPQEYIFLVVAAYQKQQVGFLKG